MKITGRGWLKTENVNSINALITKVFVYGIAAFIVWKVLSMLEDMVAAGAVDGAAALGIIGALAAGVTSFLFGVEQGRQQQKAYETGLNTPSPPAPPETVLPAPPKDAEEVA